MCHLTWLVELFVVPYWCHSSANLRCARHDIYQMRLMLPQWWWSNFLCLLMHICCQLGHDKYKRNCENKNEIWDWSMRYSLTHYRICFWLEATWGCCCFLIWTSYESIAGLFDVIPFDWLAIIISAPPPPPPPFLIGINWGWGMNRLSPQRFPWDVITHPCPDININISILRFQVMAWMNNYIITIFQHWFS